MVGVHVHGEAVSVLVSESTHEASEAVAGSERPVSLNVVLGGMGVAKTLAEARACFLDHMTKKIYSKVALS